AGQRRLPRVGVDAPRALRDLGDAERHELLGLARERAVLERLLVEVEERPVRLRGELPHALELRLDIHAVKFHDTLPCHVHRVRWEESTAAAGADQPPTTRWSRPLR